MNRQTQQLFYSQYLKQAASPERSNVDEVTELRKRIEILTQQLEHKEQLIQEMRSYQNSLLSKVNQKPDIAEFTKQFEIQEHKFQIQRVENLELKQQNQKLQKQLEEVKVSQNSKFVKAVVDLVVQCHPKDFFVGEHPDLKLCWRWLKKVLMEYIQLKR